MEEFNFFIFQIVKFYKIVEHNRGVDYYRVGYKIWNDKM